MLPTRVVANGPYSALSHNNQVSSWTNTMTRMTFYAATDLTSIQLAYANFRNLDSAGASSSVVMAVSASIEYPAGTVLAQVLFSGNSDGSIPKGHPHQRCCFRQYSEGCGLLRADLSAQRIVLHVVPRQPDRRLVEAERRRRWTMTIGSAGSTSQYTFGPFAIIGPSNARPSAFPVIASALAREGASGYFRGQSPHPCSGECGAPEFFHPRALCERLPVTPTACSDHLHAELYEPHLLPAWL